MILYVLRTVLDSGTCAADAICVLMEPACARNEVLSKSVNRITRSTDLVYAHRYPATHRHCSMKLERAGLRVLSGQLNWLRPEQYELAGQDAQVFARMARSP